MGLYAARTFWRRLGAGLGRGQRLRPARRLDARPRSRRPGRAAPGRRRRPSRSALRRAAARRRRPRRCGRARRRCPRPACPRASSSPARRLREPSASTVATRSPVPARPANVSGCGALVARERVDLGEDLAGGGAGGVRAGRRGGGGGERGGVLGAAGELDADDVARVAGVEAGGAERVGDLAAEGGVAARRDERGAVAERVGGVRRAGERADRPARYALGHERGRQHPERRHEALGHHEHARALRDRAAVGRDRGGQRGGRDGEGDEVVARELELGRRA